MVGILSILIVIMAPWLYKICQNLGLKSNESSSHEETWRKLKCLLLSERSQGGKRRVI